MTKNMKRIIGLSAGLLLWAFFLIQEEFAFYSTLCKDRQRSFGGVYVDLRCEHLGDVYL